MIISTLIPLLAEGDGGLIMHLGERFMDYKIANWIRPGILQADREEETLKTEN